MGYIGYFAQMGLEYQTNYLVGVKQALKAGWTNAYWCKICNFCKCKKLWKVQNVCAKIQTLSEAQRAQGIDSITKLQGDQKQLLQIISLWRA